MRRKEKKELTKKELRMRKKKRWRNLLIAEGLILVLLVGVLFVWLKLGMITFDDVQTETNELDEQTVETMTGYTTIAIFGVDNRSNGNYDTGNSDSIMIANINNDTKQVKVISVYRDTCMDVDGDETFRKCNYAYNHGGPQAAINMLNRNLDLEIDGYVAVDFYALVGAIDALGGVEIELTSQEARIMNQSYIDLTGKIVGKKSKHVSAGLQTLDGVQAVSYCRVRYTAGDDFKRAERQREVLTKMVEKAKRASIGQLNALIDEVFPNVATSFKLPEIMKMTAAMMDYELADTAGYPFAKATGTFGKRGSLVIPCTMETNVKLLHAYLFESEEYTPSPTILSLSREIESFSGKDENDAVDYQY